MDYENCWLKGTETSDSLHVFGKIFDWEGNIRPLSLQSHAYLITWSLTEPLPTPGSSDLIERFGYVEIKMSA